MPDRTELKIKSKDKGKRCHACGILYTSTVCKEVGKKSYREHTICSRCVRMWQLHESLLARECTWEEFLHPTPRMVSIEMLRIRNKFETIEEAIKSLGGY